MYTPLLISLTLFNLVPYEIHPSLNGLHQGCVTSWMNNRTIWIAGLSLHPKRGKRGVVKIKPSRLSWVQYRHEYMLSISDSSHVLDTSLLAFILEAPCMDLVYKNGSYATHSIKTAAQQEQNHFGKTWWNIFPDDLPDWMFIIQYHFQDFKVGKKTTFFYY